MTPLPARPPVATVAVALLLGSAAALLLTWGLGVDEVASNGARVFFVVLWSYLAWSVHRGGGWVRAALIAIFAATGWGAANASSFSVALDALPAGDAIARCLALGALAAMLTPSARRWFAETKRREAEAER